MIRHPIVKSRRQHIRLWFEFYKLALDDPDLQDNLAKVRTFYEPWGILVAWTSVYGGKITATYSVPPTWKRS
jgi:hypothetical protein